jgi:hypothetical protein
VSGHTPSLRVELADDGSIKSVLRYDGGLPGTKWLSDLEIKSLVASPQYDQIQDNLRKLHMMPVPPPLLELIPGVGERVGKNVFWIDLG